jgi:hypothetical protein
MHSRVLRWTGLLAIAAYLFSAMTGCAEARAPINRVQAEALSKHFFVGADLSATADDPEFYFGTRIVDEPYGIGQDFEMFQSIGTLARIKWEIQESVLIARLTYDRVQDSDYNGARTTDSGQLVAEFNISSHFDIIRDYNPQTGEQLNVIVENTTDRPWYQREYFRVDWSQNLVTDSYDFDQFAVAAAIDSVKLDPLQYYVQDPSDPNAPVFDTDHGYFDVTTKLYATPQTVVTPYGTYPLCFLYGHNVTTDCNPSEVTVRLSFKQVVNDDYEPEDWNGNKMNAFGWFTADRYGYDRNYGILDQNWHRFAAKYQIWQATHVAGTQCAIDEWRDANGNVQTYQVDGNGNYVTDATTGLPVPAAGGQPFTNSAIGLDVHRDTDGDGTEDECQFYDANSNEVNPGSRCDEFTNKCDIPLYGRQTKTTPLYYGPTAPPDVFAASAHALNSWNIAVKRSVQLGKATEANRVGVDVGQANFITSEADLLTDQANGTGMTVPDIFVLCHNPVTVGDSPACGAPGLAARLGDLRYHFVDVIKNPQAPSAWGVMADFDDPLTGEKVQASINVWDYVTDIASQSVEDLLRWLDGEISNTQIANGTYMSQWVSGSQLSTAQYKPAVLSKKEVQSRLNSIDRSIAKLNGLPSGALPPQVAATLAASNLAAALGPSLDSQLEGTRSSLLGTTWEAQLITPDVLQEAGFDPQQPFAGDPTTLSLASPLRGLDHRVTQWVQTQLNTAYRLKEMCILEDEQPEPDSLIGMARQAETLFPQPNPKDAAYPAELYQRDQAMHQWIREQFHTSVIAHEMGHSMGLRHNFTGSWDALNYHTEYWQLRTRNGQEHYCGYPGSLDALTPHTDGTDCVGPRWVDPVTDTETNDLIWKWGSTTVMDYPGDQTQDMNDIGLYDKAAMRFGYTNLVDVEKSMKYTSTSGSTGGSGSDYLQAVDGFGGIFGASVGQNHYSTFGDKYALLGKCSARAGWNGDPKDPLAQQCSGPNLDFVAERDMKTVPKFDQAILSVRPDLVANFAVAPGNLKGASSPPSASGQSVANSVRHPYQFGSDEFADFGNLPVLRFDAGADSYEQMQFLISTYENRYIFNNFRRNRVTFNTEAVVAALQSRYWDKISYITKGLALGVELLSQPGQPDPTTEAGSLMPMALASSDGLAMFIRAMTRPAPGTYTINPAQGVVTPNQWGGAWQLGDQGLETPPPSVVNIALGSGEGRFLHNDYDYTQGYWWADYQTQVGSFYEKRLAPVYLTEAYNNFVSNTEDDYIDGRYKNLSYLSLYPNQVRRIFANMMATNSATQVNQSGSVAQIFTTAAFAMPASTSGAANPLTQAQYLPWEKYDPTDSTTTTLQYPNGAVLLDPLIGWEEQYPALINLFWYGPTSLNMNLIDMLRIFSPGDAASLSIPLDQQVRYRDPLTQIEYVAKNYGTENVNPAIGFATAQGIGARMIQHANYLAQLAYQVTQPPDPVTGELTYDTDGGGNVIPLATPQGTTAASFLKGYASNVDIVRQLTLFFGYGPLGHGGQGQ